MARIKKILLSVLIVFTFTTSICYVNPKKVDAVVDLSDVSYDDIVEILQNYDKYANSKFTKAMSGMASIGGIATAVRGAFTVVMKALKMFGVIPDADAEFKVNTLNRLEAISNGLNEANAHIDNIMSTLTTEFANLNLANRTNIIVADKTNIQSFKENHENKMEAFLSEFPIIIKGKYKNFYYKTPAESNLNTIAYTSEEDGVIKDVDKAVITFTKEQFVNAKKGISYNAANAETIYINIFKNLFNSINPKEYVDDFDYETFVNSGIYDWLKKAYVNSSGQRPLLNEDTTNGVRNYYRNNMNEADQNALIEKFAVQLYDALGTQFLADLANEDLGSSDSYIASLLNTFDNFYNALTSSNNPLNSQYSIFKNTWVFQGDCFYTYYVYRNKVNGQVITSSQRDQLSYPEQSNYVAEKVEGNSMLDARNYYISLAAKYAIFVETMLSVVSSETYRSKTKEIKDKYTNIVNSLDNVYNNNIITENGNIVRNYCYVTRCPLQFQYVNISGEMDTRHWLKTTFDLDQSDGYTVSNWKGDYSSADIVDNTNANIIYKLYAAHGYKPVYSFDNYLRKNGVNVPQNINSILVNEVNTKTFTSVPKSSMYVWETTNKDAGEYWRTDSVNYNLVDYQYEMPFTARKVESKYFKDMKQAVASSLNFGDGNIFEQVLSRYFVYEETISAKSDAMDMFWLAKYGNETVPYSQYITKDTIKNVDGTRVTKNEVSVNIGDRYGALFRKQVKQQANLLSNANSFDTNAYHNIDDYVDIENLTKEFNSKLVKAINTEKVSQDVNADKLINYQYDSDFGDVPYWVSYDKDYYDGTSQENEELYNRFIDYLQDEDTIDTFAKEYVDYEKRLLENSNVSKEHLKIDVSESKLNTLASLINNATAIIVDSKNDLPAISDDNICTLYYCVAEKAYALNNGASWKLKNINDLSEYIYYDYDSGEFYDAYIVDDITKETLSNGCIYYDKKSGKIFDSNKKEVSNYLIETDEKPQMPDTTKIYVEDGKYYTWSGQEYMENSSEVNTSGSLPQLDSSKYLINGNNYPYVWLNDSYSLDTSTKFEIDEEGIYYYTVGDKDININDKDSQYLFTGDTQIHNSIIEVSDLNSVDPTSPLENGWYLVKDGKFYLIDCVDTYDDFVDPEMEINSNYAYYVLDEECYYIYDSGWVKADDYEVVNINQQKYNLVYKCGDKYYRYDGNSFVELTVINIVGSLDYLPVPSQNNLIHKVNDKYYIYDSSSLGYVISDRVIKGKAEIPNVYAIYHIKNTNKYYEYSNGEFVLVNVHGDEPGEEEDYLYAYNYGIYFANNRYSVYYDGVFAPIGLIYVGDVVELPIDASDMQLNYRYDFYMLYELEINDGEITHKAYPVFDVIPTFTYKVDGVSYTIDVPDELIKEAGIKSTIRIPVIDDVTTGYTCLINHYKSIKLNDLMEDPEIFNRSIKGLKNNRYSELTVSSFSPFVVKGYKKIAPYGVPKTGVER